MFLFYGNNSKTESVFAVASAISCGINLYRKILNMKHWNRRTFAKKTIVMEQIDNEEQSNSYEPARPNKYFAFVIVCAVVLCCFAFRYRGHC